MRILRFILALIVVTALVPVAKSASGYYIGGREVPGPLPPNWWQLPALDTQIGLVYGNANGVDLLLDFGKPQLCRNQKVPLVVYVHGGWWVGGSRTGMVTSGYAAMYYQCGIAFASIDYRFTPAYQYKDIIGDCKLAIRYLRANADALGIDPDRIAIWGGSAGGHLVSIMGTAGDSDGLEGPGYPGVSSRPQVVVNDCGIEDLTAPWDATSDMVIGWFLGCQASTCPDKAKEASPAWQATADDPPIMTLHGDHDPIVAYSQALALNKSLKNVGNKGAFICIVNGDHGFGPYTGGVTVTPDWVRQIYLRFYHILRYIEPGLFCDLNVDGIVNSTDSAELDSLLGLSGINDGGAPTSTTWNTQADTYSDGVINYKDWQTFSKVSALPPKFALEIIPSAQDIGDIRVQIKNLGQLDIRNYKVTLTVPPQLILKSSSVNLAVNGQTITYSDLILPAWQTKTLDLVFKTSNSPSIAKALQLTIKSELTAPEDILPIQASAKISLPSLSLLLGSSMMKAMSGEKPVLTAIARNTSFAPVKNAMLWISLPKELTCLTSTPQGTKTGNKLLLDIGTMSPGSSVSFKLTTQVAEGLESGSLIAEAGLSSDQTFDLADSCVLTITKDIPGSNPELLIKWDGIDTKTSATQAGKQITANVFVEGGTSPYSVTIDWSDNIIDKMTSNGSNPLKFSHTFQSSGECEVTVACVDSAARSKLIKRRIKVI